VLQEFLPSTLAKVIYMLQLFYVKELVLYTGYKAGGPHNLPGCSSRDINSVPPEDQIPEVHPIANHFTELAILAPLCINMLLLH
jgi:hypothetical protein